MHFSAVLADEVEDHVRSPAGDAPGPRPATWRVVAGYASVVVGAPSSLASSSAASERSTTVMCAVVSALRDWTPMCPSPPAPITTLRAGGQQRHGLADGVVGGEAGVGEGGDVPRLRATGPA